MNIFKRWKITLAGLWVSALTFTSSDRQSPSQQVMNISSFDDDQSRQLTSRHHYSFKQNDFIQNINTYLKYNNPNPPLLLNEGDISQGLDFIYMNYFFYQEDGQNRFMNFIQKVSQKDSIKYLDQLYDLTEDLKEESEFYPRDSFDRQEIIDKSRKIYQDLAIIDQVLLHYAPVHRHAKYKVNHFYLTRSRDDALALVGLDNYAESIGIFDLSLPESDIYLKKYLTPGDACSPFYPDGLYEITTSNHAFVVSIDKQHTPRVFDSNDGVYANHSLLLERIKRYAHEESNQLLVHSYAIEPSRKKLLFAYQDSIPRDKIQAQLKQSNDLWKKYFLSTQTLTAFEKKFIAQMFLFDCLVKSSYTLLKNEIDFLLTLNVDINLGWQDQPTPLEIALSLRDMDMIQLLIDKGANIHLLDAKGNTLLMRTVYLGYLEGVDYLMAQGIDINTQNHKGQTALHIALENRCSGIASLLIQKGINSSLIDNYGRTALHIAADKNYLNIIQLLVKRGASLDIKNSKSKTPLTILPQVSHLRKKQYSPG
ncbi:ankyrin repeat domain-containing protein [bacterium]|nr:ankyrin repeat domain-containing protein [bacterium]